VNASLDGFLKMFELNRKDAGVIPTTILLKRYDRIKTAN